MSGFDTEILKVLIACGCSQHALKFEGLSIKKVFTYTLEDFIPLVPDAGQEVAHKIAEEFQKYKISKESQQTTQQDDNHQSVNVQPETVKTEIVNNEQDSSTQEINFTTTTTTSPVNMTLSEQLMSKIDSASYDDEVLRILSDCNSNNVSITLKFAGLTVADLYTYTLEDFIALLPEVDVEVAHEIYQQVQVSKAQNESQENMDVDEYLQISHSFSSTNNDTSTSQDSQSSDEEEMKDDHRPGRIILEPKRPATGLKFIDRNDAVYVRIMSQSQVHNCKTEDPSKVILKRWNDGLDKWGSNIRSLEMTTWTWKESSSCPYNLFKFLSQQCPSLRELSLIGNIVDDSDEDQDPPYFALPKLRVIRISHSGDFDYANELSQIIRAACNLRKINFSYGTLNAANSFLKVLRDLRKNDLKNLKILSIKSHSKDGYLKEFQILQLAKIEAISLEELELGDGLWEDVEGPSLQEMFYRFSTLRKLIIRGSFTGTSEVKPKILINLPPMNHLEYLSIGTNDVHNSPEDEDEDEVGPSPKILRGFQGKIKKSNSDPSLAIPTSFPVTVHLPFLPQLKTLDLGNLFEIFTLDFNRFPKVETFFVGGRWDVLLKSPHESYPLVKHLQIPDCLSDPSFVKLIPHKFPNLTYCLIYVPTPAVLRTFFKTMENSNLQELYLKTQFDFESTLETCLLDKPSEVKRCPYEVEKMWQLREYGHWEEFVKFHNIQLPEEILPLLERKDMAGLGALKNLKSITFEHFQRKLWIPAGDLHWANPNCEFTEDYIGFKKYPWSRACENVRNYLRKKNLKDAQYLGYHVPFRTAKEPSLTRTIKN